MGDSRPCYRCHGIGYELVYEDDDSEPTPNRYYNIELCREHCQFERCDNCSGRGNFGGLMSMCDVCDGIGYRKKTDVAIERLLQRIEKLEAEGGPTPEERG